jgi:hypothetical protein
VQYAVNAEAVVNRAAPELATALDELELLADRLAASARGDETVTLLLEPVGPASKEALAVVARTLPPSVGGTPGAFVFHGPGMKHQLQPWLGYAQVAVKNEDGTLRRALLRTVLLDGEHGVVEAWKERQRAEREARRRGADPTPDPHPVLVLERTELEGPARFVATGLTDATKHLAAWLRASAK